MRILRLHDRLNSKTRAEAFNRKRYVQANVQKSQAEHWAFYFGGQDCLCPLKEVILVSSRLDVLRSVCLTMVVVQSLSDVTLSIARWL